MAKFDCGMSPIQSSLRFVGVMSTPGWIRKRHKIFVQLCTQVFGSYDLMDYQFLDKITRPFPDCPGALAGWEARERCFLRVLEGGPVSQNRLDGLASCRQFSPSHTEGRRCKTIEWLF